MIPEQPKIANVAYGVRRNGRQRIRSVRLFAYLFEALDAQVDLANLEPGGLEAKVEVELGQFLELLAQDPVVPGGGFGQSVVGDLEGFGLRLVQVIEPDRWHLGPPKITAGQQTAVSGHDGEIGIDQDRHIEPERRDALGNLADLPATVAARVVGV